MTAHGGHHLSHEDGAAAGWLTSEQVRNHELPQKRWGGGYQQGEVRQVLGLAADRIADLEQQVQQLSRMLQQRETELEQRRYGVGLPASGSPAELVHSSHIDWQVQAQAYSDNITSTAQAQADQIVGEAHHQARLIRSQAQQEVERYRNSAGAAYNVTEEDLVRLRSLAYSMQEWLHDVRQNIVAADDTLSAELVRYKRILSGERLDAGK
ncbi:MAG TPA: DivIVA domain-containing protein [Micromonospora sp.]